MVAFVGFRGTEFCVGIWIYLVTCTRWKRLDFETLVFTVYHLGIKTIFSPIIEVFIYLSVCFSCKIVRDELKEN